MRTFGIAASIAAGLAGLSSAQNVGPLPPLTAQVEVHVVNVDVSVTDAKGNPLLDITKDDFELFNSKNSAGYIGNRKAKNYLQPTHFAGDPGQGEQRLAQLGLRVAF